MNYSYKTTGVCSKKIDITIEGDIITAVNIVGGCHGNSQGVARLTEGLDVNTAIKKLEGINCMGKGTSCPDQLSKALKSTLEK